MKNRTVSAQSCETVKQTRRSKFLLIYPFNNGNPIIEEIDEFAHSTRNGVKPETDGESALEALRLIRAAIDSARTGEKTAL